jgi:hypothetical protein
VDRRLDSKQPLVHDKDERSDVDKSVFRLMVVAPSDGAGPGVEDWWNDRRPSFEGCWSSLD